MHASRPTRVVPMVNHARRLRDFGRSSFTQPLPCAGVHAILSCGGKTMSLESMLASLAPDWHGYVLAHRIAILLACLDFQSMLPSMMSGSD